MKYELVIFDFDGTLVDTITDVALCFNAALARCGLPQHPPERFGAFVGGDLETVVSRMLPPDAVTEENITRVKTEYRALYAAGEKPNTKLYDGMWELLLALKACGCALAVNSNKGQALLEGLIGQMFPTGFFDAVVGYCEACPSKPDPTGVRSILHECGVLPEKAVYVGDGMSDVRTAYNAGIDGIFVTWGQGQLTDEAAASCVRYIAETVGELKDYLVSES